MEIIKGKYYQSKNGMIVKALEPGKKHEFTGVVVESKADEKPKGYSSSSWIPMAFEETTYTEPQNEFFPIY